MTPLDKNISRECPGILNSEGRPLQVTLTPEEEGTLVLKWKGLRANSSFELGLGMLIRFAEKKAAGTTVATPEPSGSPSPPRDQSGSPSPPRGAKAPDKTEWVRYEDILSKIHILPGLTCDERKKLVDTIKGLRDLQEELANL